MGKIILNEESAQHLTNLTEAEKNVGILKSLLFLSFTLQTLIWLIYLPFLLCSEELLVTLTGINFNLISLILFNVLIAIPFSLLTSEIRKIFNEKSDELFTTTCKTLSNEIEELCGK